ncbi:hypothetical protein E2C01_054782 [Portunus trituberculatus]|uniref:Uncharacterized protein n=1 Tax=Portunus trituberculatus TaxID=210409 RepID=A0A5B7GT49_PORTR|nr:hypothetical protein [Portunus trituberculatus]
MTVILAARLMARCSNGLKSGTRRHLWLRKEGGGEVVIKNGERKCDDLLMARVGVRCARRAGQGKATPPLPFLQPPSLVFINARERS